MAKKVAKSILKKIFRQKLATLPPKERQKLIEKMDKRRWRGGRNSYDRYVTFKEEAKKVAKERGRTIGDDNLDRFELATRMDAKKRGDNFMARENEKDIKALKRRLRKK